MTHNRHFSVAAILLAVAGFASATEPATVYGSQLMTQQERIDYRNRMSTLDTQQQRDAFRLDHHAKMQERAAERGLRLPDAPPATGAGMGPGMGGGMGPGGGRGR